jgi:hypothetical protein
MCFLVSPSFPVPLFALALPRRIHIVAMADAFLGMACIHLLLLFHLLLLLPCYNVIINHTMRHVCMSILAGLFAASFGDGKLIAGYMLFCNREDVNVSFGEAKMRYQRFKADHTSGTPNQLMAYSLFGS